MFTGIIETLAEIKSIEQIGSNYRIWLSCSFVDEIQIDQSIAHDGVCLTVVEISDHKYAVDAIAETLSKTNLKQWKVGKKVNVERCLTLEKRIDGHIVQGHVDTVLTCIHREDKNGSWLFTFQYPEKWYSYLIPTGSVTINGTSLTIAKLTDDTFSVAIIPYTYEFTNFHQLQVNDFVNIEFDMIGKYINRIQEKTS